MIYVRYGFLITILMAFIIAIAFTLSPIDPKEWQPAGIPDITSLPADKALDKLETILSNQIDGPEDIAKGPDGWFYAGGANGDILRFKVDGKKEVFATTGGRPLGLEFDRDGNLIVADAIKGLLKISTRREVHVLVDAYQGEKMRFVDDLDIAEDGTIWFSDASQRHGMKSVMHDMLEASATGRLFSYSPSSNQLRLRLDTLFFANGVALAPDDAFVLVAESGRGTIKRLWLKGEKEGEVDVFNTGLPGHPDNISFDGTDTFWVALASRRTHIFNHLADLPTLRSLIALLPESLLPNDEASSMVASLNLDGEVTGLYLSSTGKYRFITSANQFGDTLFIGSLKMHSVGLLSLASLRDASH